MFWADKISRDIIQSGKYKPYWVDDMKTPSGRIHVGALRGVVIHDLVFKALKDLKVNTKYTYVFDDHDPMDALPVYLSKEKYEKYLGMPLYKIPSPDPKFKNFAEYYALEFKDVFNAIGCNPEIIWATDFYLEGRMNPLIKLCLDKAEVIRGIYSELYKHSFQAPAYKHSFQAPAYKHSFQAPAYKKKIPSDWYPFQVYCPNCGKVSTTRVYDWDGQKVSFTCEIERLEWAKGCGHKGKISPFSSKDGILGKLPWKVEWPCKWKIIGVTIEGGGKDHMSAGGSHDLASLICKRVLDYPVPYPLPYEFFLVGGKKMSSSKGLGSSASEMLEILPPEILRFLMVKTRINQAINFDPSGNTIPNLFDEYQKAATSSDSDLKRIFELSQIRKVQNIPKVRFSTLAQWVQMPNMDEEIKKEGLEEWAPYAKRWVEKFAPDDEKFTIQKELPKEVKKLSKEQKELLSKIAKELDKKWEGEDFQTRIYEIGKELGLNGAKTFEVIYISLLGKNHGPKAAWLILSLDKKFVQKRFGETYSNNTYYRSGSNSKVEKVDSAKQKVEKVESSSTQAQTVDPKIFSIDKKVTKRFPSVSIGVAIIKRVKIEKSNSKLEKEKSELLSSFKNLTTETLGQYPEIQSYRKLYKEMGIDWHSRRPSPEALLRRVALKKGLYMVNTCVDAYNLVVMRHRVSIGAFDLDTLSFPTVLRFPNEREEILLLGDTEPTEYQESELAYFDQKGGFNIDFNYRDAQRTSVQLTTKNLYINVDGIYDITSEQVQQSLQEACDEIIKYCGGEIELLGVKTAS